MKIIFLFFLLVVGTAILPSTSHATGVPFGGFEIAAIPCTCDPVYSFGVFAPLFLGMIPSVGALAAPTIPVLFSFYELHPGAWALGKMVPGVQACYIFVGFGCLPLPTEGFITPFAGVSAFI